MQLKASDSGRGRAGGCRGVSLFKSEWGWVQYESPPTPTSTDHSFTLSVLSHFFTAPLLSHHRTCATTIPPITSSSISESEKIVARRPPVLTIPFSCPPLKCLARLAAAACYEHPCEGTISDPLVSPSRLILNQHSRGQGHTTTESHRSRLSTCPKGLHSHRSPPSCTRRAVEESRTPQRPGSRTRNHPQPRRRRHHQLAEVLACSLPRVQVKPRATCPRVSGECCVDEMKRCYRKLIRFPCTLLTRTYVHLYV